MEPVIDDVDSETAFFPFQDLRLEEALTDATMQPHASAMSNFKFSFQSLSVLDDRSIQIWNSNFETVSHGKLVSEHQQFVWKRGPNFKKLKAAQLVGQLYLRQQRLPRVERLTIQAFMKNTVTKQPVDLLRRRKRKHVLMPIYPILHL